MDSRLTTRNVSMSKIIRTYGAASVTHDDAKPRISRSVYTPSVRTTHDEETRELPELRDSTSPVTVRLSRTSREAMRNEVFTLTRSDDLECGSYLFAEVPRSWHKEIYITHATTTGDAMRRNGSMKLDTSRWEDAEKWIIANGWHEETMVGFYHSHPDEIGRDAGLPSDADLYAFLAARDLAEKYRGVKFSVGLILTLGRTAAYGSEYSWVTPGLHAWVTRRTDAGTPITERADVLGWR
jgi:proteasome lid subunit RPN8/RPN11